MNETTPSAAPSRAWPIAARLLERWRTEEERVDSLLEKAPAGLTRFERARVQNLLYGALRHRTRIEAHLDEFVARPPRPIIWAVLLLAGYELLEGGEDGHAARVGHHAVEQTKRLASPKEAGLVNAVVRKLAVALADETPPGDDAPVPELARYFSHPEWLVERWISRLGRDTARDLLKSNQTIAPVYARWRRRDRAPNEVERSWLRPVDDVPDFFAISPGHWEDVQPYLQDGSLYIQDPATRHAIDLLAPQPGEDVVDVCAAPGGKSLALADRMEKGRVVSIDLPGPRMRRLEQNLKQMPPEVKAFAVAGDLRRTGLRLLESRHLPTEVPAVLIDVPCSNTGVMRHRVDVKWRLQPDDIRRNASQQFELLDSAARLVAPGGRIVYSTCSLEPEENEQVVDAFVRRSRGAFERVAERSSRPWLTGYDGASAFLLRRKA